jgi:hypothetical protein
MNHAHLTDDQLIALCVDGSARGTRADEVRGCASCGARLASLSGLLREVSVASELDADAAFPADRLARQRARILQRLGHRGHLARVLAFPAAHAPHTSVQPRSARRWVAGAAAAGLIIGMAAGRMAHQFQGLRPIAQESAAVRSGAGVPLQASSSAADDEFLQELEAALSFSPAGLRRLDSVTPVAWEQPR